VWGQGLRTDFNQQIPRRCRGIFVLMEASLAWGLVKGLQTQNISFFKSAIFSKEFLKFVHFSTIEHR
jgi:hypothetical protein